MKKFKGFTLVELIVVIAIIVILSGILALSLVGYVRKAKEAAIKVECKCIYNAATAAIADTIISQRHQLLTTKTYNGKKCGCITNWMIAVAQNGEESRIASKEDNWCDYQTSKAILEALDSEKAKTNFYKFNGAVKNPLGMKLKDFNKAFPGVSGFILIYDVDGTILRIEYSKGNMLCSYNGGEYTITYAEKGAQFTNVKYP